MILWPATIICLGLGPVDLLGLKETSPGARLPAGWEIQPVKNVAPPLISVHASDSAPVLRIEGAGTAAWLHRSFRLEAGSGGGRLRWSWRVLETPADADLRRKDRDDSAIRLFVIFGNPRGLFTKSGRIIFYSTGGQEPPDFAGRSHVNGRIQIIRTVGADRLGEWVELEVDPEEDYRRIWGRNAPSITAVGLMQDTDQTGTRAIAEVRRIEWVSDGAMPVPSG